MRRLASLLLPVVMVIMLGAIALGGYLAFGSARMAYQSLIDSRLGEIAARIDAAAEQALSLGLPLAGQDTLDALAARGRAADPAILSIDITDAAGVVLHSSDAARIGLADTTHEAGVRARRSPVVGPFGDGEGWVVVRADAGVIAAPLDALALEVRAAVIVAGLAAVVLVVPAVLLPLARLNRRALRLDGSAAQPGELGWAVLAVDASQQRLAAGDLSRGAAIVAPRRPAWFSLRFDRLVITLLTAVLMLSIAFVAGRTVVAAEKVLLPALGARAEVSARSLASLVATAGNYGIGLDRIYGAGPVLEAVVRENRQFAAAAILDPAGRPVAVAVRSADGIRAADEMPPGLDSVVAPVIAPDGTTAARVAVAVPPSVAVDLVRDLWLDITVVVMASVLITLEVLAFVLGLDAGALMQAFARRLDALRRGDLSSPAAGVSGQGRLARAIASVDGHIAGVRARHEQLRRQAERAGDTALTAELDAVGTRFRLSETRADPPAVLQRVRMPLFLFFLAEEMTRPFLPGFTAGLTSNVTIISHALAISLPIVLFMAIVAFSQPWLAGLTERFGRARALRLGAAVAVAGFAGTAFAGGLGQLLLFRSLVAVGYAAVFVGAQGVIIDSTSGPTRARGLSLLVTAIMVAALCGPPVGGILADRLGVRNAFLVSALVAAVAFLVARFTLPADHVRADARIAGVALRDMVRVLSRPAMALLLVGCAFPAKLILAGLSFFLVPVVMGAAGFDDAVIGRVLMLYAVSMLVLVPLVARWSDGAGRRPAFVIGGGLIAATAVLHPFWLPQPWGAAAMVLQLGLGQALSITPQSALVGEIGRRIAPDLPENTLYGVFRLVERLGNAAGPALAAVLLARFGAPAALAGIGALVAAGALAFAAANRQTGKGASVARAASGAAE